MRETAEIGSFVFTGESSVSAGIRRVEALTGFAAHAFVQSRIRLLGQIAQLLGANTDGVIGRIGGLQADLVGARREIETLRRRLAKVDFDRMLENQLESLNGVQALLARVEAVPPETMREMTDWFRHRVDKGVMVLGQRSGWQNRISLWRFLINWSRTA